MSDHFDFDEHTLPPEGQIRRIMDRHDMTRSEALRSIGIDPQPSAPASAATVPFGELEPGDFFRHSNLTFKKIRPRVQSWYGTVVRFTATVHDPDGPSHGHQVAYTDEVDVEPIDHPNQPSNDP